MKGFLDYLPGDSLIHRLDPRTKLLLALMICIGCFCAASPLVLLALIGFDLLIGVVGGIAGQACRLLKGLLKISVFLFLLQVLFIQEGAVLLTLPLGILITDHGVLTAVQVVLRLVGATLPLALMITLTKPNDLANALVCGCHIPYKYAFAVTSAIRFIPAFAADLQAIMEVQTARGIEFDTGSFLKKVKLIIPLCVPLLISSVKKIEGAAIAAELRGFNLRTAGSCSKPPSFHAIDLPTVLSGVVVIAVGVFF